MINIIFLVLAFLSYERMDGMYRHCTYNAPGGEYTITIPISKLCPLTIEL